MISTSDKERNKSWQLWSALGIVAIAAFATFMLTRPAAAVMSMTPLSGLMTLKATAVEAMPYDAALASQKQPLSSFMLTGVLPAKACRAPSRRYTNSMAPR
ncbi:MAG: hypothetical protein AAFQ74_03515 [Cyanobacteria bacterium J06623_4]